MEKEQKLGLKKTLSNIMYALGLIWKGAPAYVLVLLLVSLEEGLAGFWSETYLLYYITDSLEAGKAFFDMLNVLIVVGSAILLCSVLRIGFDCWWSIPGSKKVCWNVAKSLYQKASEVELACFETPSFYDRYCRAIGAGQDKIFEIFNVLMALLVQVVFCISAVSMMAVIDPMLLLFAVAPFLYGLLVKPIVNRIKHERENACRDVWRRADYVRRIFYQGEYAKEMRLSHMPILFSERLYCHYRAIVNIRKKYGVKEAFFYAMEQFVMLAMCLGGSIAYAVWRVSRGEMDIASCTVVLNTVVHVSDILIYLVDEFGSLGENALFMEDMQFLLRYKSKIPENETGKQPSVAPLQVSDVSFRYTDATDDTLKHINLTLHPGEKIALVGRNGSGKTTLIKMLLRLYDPTEGKITMGEDDIKDLRLSSYRDCFGCVFQDYKLLATTVRENVKLGRDILDEKVVEALKNSGSWNKISSFEKGIDTQLTREFDKRGENLSGGEAQKVALARIFAKGAPFIILDEPSSALDPVAEHELFQNMMRAAGDAGVVFVSHRLSSAVTADKIYMMQNGEIIEQGSHEELMHQNGEYAAMFRMQAENYKKSHAFGEEVAI